MSADLLLLLEEEDIRGCPMLTLGAPVLLLLRVELLRVDRLGGDHTKRATFETAKAIPALLTRRELQIELLRLLRQFSVRHNLGIELSSTKIVHGLTTSGNAFLIAGEELTRAGEDRISDVTHQSEFTAHNGAVRHPINAVPLTGLLLADESFAHGGQENVAKGDFITLLQGDAVTLGRGDFLHLLVLDDLVVLGLGDPSDWCQFNCHANQLVLNFMFRYMKTWFPTPSFTATFL